MVAARKPIGEIQYDPREEPGLGHTQESHGGKARATEVRLYVDGDFLSIRSAVALA
jgi:hypothetical protein